MVVPQGQTIYIPAYWWYSIKFLDSDSSLTCFRYRTYMNNLAISPYIAMYALQLQNVKWNVAKKLIKPCIDQNSNVDESTLYEMQSPLLSKSDEF